MARPAKRIIEYRVYELALDFPVLLLDGERWHISDIKSDRLHFHNCLEIGICHSDSGIMIFEEEAVPFKGGDVTCVPRHIPHTTYSDPGKGSLWSYIFVDLSQLFRDMFHNSQEFDKFAPTMLNFRYVMSRTDYPKIHFMAHSLLDEMREKRDGYQTVVRGLFMALYYELLRLQAAAEGAAHARQQSDASSKDTLVISPALDYIYGNYMHNIAIDYLAELCHLSTTHFRRVFSSSMSATPLHFINTLRVDKACVLLRSTDHSILTISEMVGFASISSFNRYFLQSVGISPRIFRAPTKHPDRKPERKYILQHSGWV